MCVAEPLVIYDACCNLWRLFSAVAISPQCFRAIKGQILPLTGTPPWRQEAMILERCNPILKLPGVHLCQGRLGSKLYTASYLNAQLPARRTLSCSWCCPILEGPGPWSCMGSSVIRHLAWFHSCLVSIILLNCSDPGGLSGNLFGSFPSSLFCCTHFYGSL